ncbi:MAG: trehalose-phosphatase [Bacillota bacterium]
MARCSTPPGDECWRRIRGALAAGLDLALFQDLDGTLAPLAPSPERARLPGDTRRVLESLRSLPRCLIWVVTGRRAQDALGMVGLPDIGYAGVHGLEIRWPAPRPDRGEHPAGVDGRACPAGAEELVYPAGAQEAVPAVRTALAALRRDLATVPGCLLEDKGLSVAVHYRQVARHLRPHVITTVQDVAARFPSLRLQPGHWMLELRPQLPWDKGKAVRWLLEKTYGGEWSGRVLPVYIGDDLTDEDAFASLGRRAVTIKVGPGPTGAAYRLRGPEEVTRFLQECACLLSATGPSRAGGRQWGQ